MKGSTSTCLNGWLGIMETMRLQELGIEAIGFLENLKKLQWTWHDDKDDDDQLHRHPSWKKVSTIASTKGNRDIVAQVTPGANHSGHERKRHRERELINIKTKKIYDATFHFH